MYVAEWTTAAEAPQGFEMGRMLGVFETMVMFAVLELGEGAYSVPLRNTISERSGRETSPGAVHTTLDRLERRGLVESWTGDDPPPGGGRPRRFYRITHAGIEAVRESHHAVTSMARGLEHRLAPDAPGGD